MLANGEDRLIRVLAVMPDGKTGAPCGACRELMVQLMPGEYRFLTTEEREILGAERD